MSHATRSQELEEFKLRVNLRSYAACRGYQIDKRRSSPRYTVLRHPSGEKLIVTRKPNGHWVYANAHDESDRGTIIDFVQRRDRCSIGEVRKLLRPWIGAPATPNPLIAEPPAPSPPRPDIERVRAAWRSAKPMAGRHRFLHDERKIPEAMISYARFADRLRVDQRGNALFAHHDRDGLCGFEIKNRGHTRFATGGVKGLFASRPDSDDVQLVVCETAIDALSYAALFGIEFRRFASVAGQISPRQRKLIQHAARGLPDGGEIVLAMDNDASGRKLARAIAAALAEVDLGARSVRVHLPGREGDDWNDVLRASAERRPASPTPG